MRFERRPMESAAREASAVLRLSFEPLEQACATLGRIALLRFASPDAERDFAEQLRELARDLRRRAQADSATARSLLKGIAEMERNARLLAMSKE